MGYLGSKAGAGVYQAIIGLMPPHDVYIEPFAGSGAIAKRKPPAQRTVLIDKDPAALKSIGPIAGAELCEGDGLALLCRPDADELFSGRVLVYCDPPYLPQTRTSRARYKHEFTEQDHVMLCNALRGCGDVFGWSVMLSGYPNALYDEVLEGWNTKEFQAMTRGGVRTEKLWFNFEPDAVHWASYAGENFTDRQRIKRKAARWAAKFAVLPPAERQAVLAALLDAAP